MVDFRSRILKVQPEPLTGGAIDILQVNLGYNCNMGCGHCHLASGPERTQEMGRENIEAVLHALRSSNVPVLDITGGAPELNPCFRHLVQETKKMGRHVSVRTNLTIFFEHGMEDLPQFYADNSVEVTASLPCYTEDNVDGARGKGTFKKSIKALTSLNALGYGRNSQEKRPGLNLVYNPSGPFLGPPQAKLEKDYKHELGRLGVSFDRLYVFTNSAVGRFRDRLIAAGGLEEYLALLEAAFNPATLGGLMCRHLINVGYDGALYDCDFNQALGLALGGSCPQHINDFDGSRLAGRRINVGDHCYACAAGQGST